MLSWLAGLVATSVNDVVSDQGCAGQNIDIIALEVVRGNDEVEELIDLALELVGEADAGVRNHC